MTSKTPKTPHVAPAAAVVAPSPSARDAVVSKGMLVGLTEIQARDLEIGIYNWTLQKAEACKIPRSWASQRFLSRYMAKSRSVLANLDPSSYVGNTSLLQRVREELIAPHEIAHMQPMDVYPERWKEVVELKVQRDEYAATVKPVAMSNEYRCSRCKKNDCVYQELQLRSADEPATIIITCISCSHTWRVG